MSTPPAKFCSVPLSAIPMATPAEAKSAINDEVSMPRMPMTVTINMKYSTMRTRLSTNVAKDWSRCRRTKIPLINLYNLLITSRPT